MKLSNLKLVYFIAAVAVMFSVSPLAVQGATEVQITTNTLGQASPDIYGDKIVWTDMRHSWPSFYGDIYLYDILSGQEQRITSAGDTHDSKSFPRIYGDKIIWQEEHFSETGNWLNARSIHVYDIPSEAEQTILTTSKSISGVDTDGNAVVFGLGGFFDDDNGIYLYDITTASTTRIASSDPDKFQNNVQSPKISNGKIAYYWHWVCGIQCSRYDLRLYDIASEETTSVISNSVIRQDHFAIDDGKIVFAAHGGVLYLYEIHTGELSVITTELPIDINNVPLISGIDVSRDVVVWSDNNDIFIYNIETGETERTGTAEGISARPRVYEDSVVWEDSRGASEETPFNYDIYLFTDTPIGQQPSCENTTEPCISNINPKSGAPGISLTIEGNDLNSGFVLFNFVYFGSNEAEIIEWGNDKIVVKVPPGTGEADVRVSTLTGESNKVLFTYNKPFIDTLQPETGDTRTQVKIHGQDFGIKGLSSLFGVKFGKSNALTAMWGDKEIEVKPPSDYGTGENDRNFLVCLLLVATPNTEWFSIPEKCLVWLSTLALNGIYIDTAHSAIDVDVKVITPAGESNTKTFTYQLLPLAAGDLNSPGELRVYDSQGRMSGMVRGEIQEEIPTSLYDSENEIVAIPRAEDQYSYEVIGTGNDTYGLNLVFAEQATTTIFKAIDIPIKVGEVHKYSVDWEKIRQNEDGITLQIDADGDGIFEKKVVADNTLTQDEFILQTETKIDIAPDVLNLKSKGNVITAYIELPYGFAPDKIDTTTIMLNGIIPSLEKPIALGDYDNDGIADLMVKFDREKVKQLFIDSGEKIEVQVAGSVFHNNEYLKFAGTDYIRLIK